MPIDTVERVVFEFAMGSTRKVVCRINEYRGKVYCDTRIFFLNDEGAWCPTSKGISVHSDYVPELRQAAEQFAKALGQGDTQTAA